MGLCAMVALNPSGALPSFKQMCEAIASWHEIHSAELRQQLAQILAGFKQVSPAHPLCSSLTWIRVPRMPSLCCCG